MTKCLRMACLGIVLSCFGFQTALAASNPPPVTKYKMTNGLTTLIKVDKRSPVVMVQVWYKIGSSDERLGETGISHFLEHMMFQGTTTFPPGELKRIIAIHGGEENAYTTRDYTVYFDMMANNQLDRIFELEADRMENLSFSSNQFLSEKQVILEERRMRVGDSPLRYAQEQTRYVSDVASPYANPIIGWRSDLEQMTIRQLYNWYFKWYGPNNATLVVVGDVDPKKVEAKVRKYFGSLKSVVAGVPMKFPLQKQLGEKTVVVHRPGSVPAVIMTYRVPSLVTAKDPKTAFALLVASDLLAGMHSSRLDRDLVRNQAVATSIGVSYQPVAKYPTNLTIIARPAPGTSLSSLSDSIKTEIQTLSNSGPTAVELARVIKVVQARHIFNLDKLSNQAALLGSTISVGLPWQLSDNYVKQVGKVTAKEVQQVTAKYLNDNNLTLGEYIPLKGKKAYQSVRHSLDTAVRAYS